ncbi:TetR family transcriptional regulator [Chloroflexia bacterium SDU3-3]|nr:TetR family transcriptional regulator [Chloroflexia bacterium SDU3-3]
MSTMNPKHKPLPPPSLRERRRLELIRSIANAAVELFEQKGFAATTVDDIAAAAGVSRTTFFRHCTGKEAAVLADEAGLEEQLIAVAAHASKTHPLQDLEEAWDAMASVFDSDSEGNSRFLRVRRLMKRYPSLHAAGLQRQTVLFERLADTLRSHANVTELDAYTTAESFGLVMRLTLDEWVRRADQGNTKHMLQEIYREVRDSLNRVTKRRS